jgi:hypothetical protein
MSTQEPLKPELLKLESALASLAPRPAALDRDWVMFLAGRAAARETGRRRGAWLWPCATAASLLLALGLGLRGQWPIGPSQEEAEVAAAASSSERPGPNSYFKLRELVLTRGVDDLPDPTASSGRRDAQPLRPLDRNRFDAWLGG